MKRMTTVLGLTLCLVASPALQASGLAALWQEMQQASPELHAGRMGYVASQQESAQAQAALLPALSAGVGSSWTDQQLSDQGRQQVGSNGYAVVLQMPLVDVVAWRKLDIARLQEIAARWRWQARQRQLMLQLAEAWFALQNAQVLQTVATHRLAQLTSSLQRTSARFRAGEVTAVDVDEVRAAYDLADSDAAQARSQLAQAQDTLRQFTGRDMSGVTALTPRLLPSVRSTPLSWWLDQGQQHNDSSAIAALNWEIAARRLSQINAEWLPRVDMVASWNHSNHAAADYQHARGFTTVDGVTTAQGAGDSAVIGVQLTLPLYSGGETLSRERQAVALSEQARYQWQSERNQAEIHIRRLYSALINGQQRMQALQQAAHSSARASASVALGYSLGERISADLLAAQQQQDEVRNRIQQEQSRYLLNWLTLLQLTGQLDARNLAEIDKGTAETDGQAITEPQSGQTVRFVAFSPRQQAN